jgi:GNAT superfamily N-acetyltransferase
MVDDWLEPALICANHFYARMFRDWPSAVTRTIEQYTVSYSGDVRLTGANHLWLHEPAALTPDTLEEAGRFFDHFKAAWSVVYTDAFMPGAGPFLRSQGYFRRWHSPLMVLDTAPYSLPINPAARVIRASRPEHIAHIGRVLADTFATDASVNRRVARVEHLVDPDITHYLIYEGREPAACATVARHCRMAGIWNVGTRYAFRRRRYATTLMVALLNDLAAEGYDATMLLASPMGRPLYEQLGYRPIGMVYYMGPTLSHGSL